jgi:prepilin-type N-terminal cleavage/methylation domain-containing protein
VRSAFTLVELMIVVAIVGVLSAIAVSNFHEAQMRAKRQEAVVNIDGIATAQVGYEAANDTYVTTATSPGTSLTKQLRKFNPALSGWPELGWQPDGEVRCNYKASGFGGDTWYRVDATCDIDNDNRTMIMRYYSPESSTPGWRDLYPDRF